MPSPLQELLTHNAFRTLGLSASATNQDVDAASRRMRIWPDPTRVPPTPWDLYVLGPLDRSRPAIDRAVTTLRQPQSRLADRVLWYMGTAPVVLDETALSANPITVHGYAIAALHAAVVSDPLASDNSQWSDAIDRLNSLARLDTFTEKLRAVETDAGFEVRVSDAEVVAAVRNLPGRVAGALATIAVEALGKNDLPSCVRIGRLVRQANNAEKATDRMLEAMENALMANCRGIVQDLENRLRSNEQNPEPFYFDNRHAARQNAHRCNEQVFPLLHAIANLSDDVSLVQRAGSGCCEALILLALAWEWGGDFVRAEEVLTDALRWAGESPSAYAIRIALERVRPEVERQQRWTARTVQPSPDSYMVYQTGTFDTNLQAGSGFSNTTSSVPPVQYATQPSSSARRTQRTVNSTGKNATIGWIVALFLFLFLGFSLSILRSSSSKSLWHTSPPRPLYSPSPYKPSIHEQLELLNSNGRTPDELLRDLRLGLATQPAIGSRDSRNSPRNPYRRPPLSTTRPIDPDGNFDLGEFSRER